MDYWSLGIVLYELVFLKRPFQAKSTEELKYAILKQEIEYPQWEATPRVISLIKALLKRDVPRRLGSPAMDGSHGFQQHTSFQHLDWTDVLHKRIAPSFTPVFLLM